MGKNEEEMKSKNSAAFAHRAEYLLLRALQARARIGGLRFLTAELGDEARTSQTTKLKKPPTP
eukprot:5318538-Amphidinium_carterae.1